MNSEQSGTAASARKTPPKQSASWPPTPPRTVERQTLPIITSVQELRRHWDARLEAGEADQNTRIHISKGFSPHQHIVGIELFFRQFDCYRTALCVRMPSPIHELVIGGLERDYTIKQFQLGGRCSEIKLGRSSRVYLDGNKESRQPDMQFRHILQRKPRVIIEVAYTQPENELDTLANDYILKSDGTVRRVYGINLEPLGKPSTVAEWRARVTPSNDPKYDEEVRVEKTLYKAFRAADGSLVNPDECLIIKFSDFDMDGDGPESEISIPFRSIFEMYDEAEHMEAQSELEDEAQRPAKRVKRIARTPSPVEQLKSKDEARFQAAEEADELTNKDSDFEPVTDDESESDRSRQQSHAV